MLTLFLICFAVLLVLSVALGFFLNGWWRLIAVFVAIAIVVAAWFLAQWYFLTPAIVEVDYPPTQAPLDCPSYGPGCYLITPVVTEVTPEPEPPFDVTINGCPVGSLGTNPNTGEPLIFKSNPYPGVLCEFEVYYATQIAKISFPDGQTPLVQDWAISCPTGPLCEGTWVQTKTSYVPAGVLVHYWVYPNRYTVKARFPSFACEYLAYGNKGHTNENIRTAPWAIGSGSTFNVPACAGFTGEPGK